MATVTNGSGTESYTYGPDNKRIWKKKPNGTEEMYFYGITGQKLGTWQRSGSSFTLLDINLYFGGKQIVARSQTVVLDRLASVRKAGATESDYYPYGYEQATTANDKDKFATYYRDQTTGWIMQTRDTTAIPLAGLRHLIRIRRTTEVLATQDARELGIAMPMSVEIR